MKIAGLDLETTGLDAAKGDKIIEIALLTYDMATEALADTYIQRVDPERSIAPKAQEIHGISYESLVGKPKFKDIVETVYEKLKGVELIVIHNAAFDSPFLAVEFNNVGKRVSFPEVFCTMENGRWATPNGKLPNLGELAFSLEVPYDKSKAHAAQYDVEILMQCFFKGTARGFYGS